MILDVMKSCHSFGTGLSKPFLHLCCQTKRGSQWKVNGSSQLRSLESTRDLHLATAKALSKFSCGKEITSKSCPFSEVTSGYGSKPWYPDGTLSHSWYSWIFPQSYGHR